MIYLKTLLLLLLTQAAIAAPWMTGPLLAANGKTIPAGHVNIEPYAFYTVYQGDYTNFEPVPIVSIGLTNFLDIQAAFPYDFDWSRGQYSSNLGDYTLGLGLQVLRQKEHSWLPDLRITIQEVFPTGKFDNLDPGKFGADQTGTGSYRTSLAFNFQHLKEFHNQHYLRTRFNLTGGTGTDVQVDGLSAFGGNQLSHGKVSLGNSYSADLAFEYSLTQHWVPVFEMLYVTSQETGFSGNPGFTPQGTLDSIGGAGGNQLSLAPAIEYNFTPNIGLIGGVWFSVTGPPSGQFTTYAIALNYYF
jgi:hypothetical protein